MEYNRDEIANRIFAARKNSVLKQIEVCNYLNISQSMYSDIETGKRDVTLPVLFKLSELFSISIEWLIGVDLDSSFTSDELLQLELFKGYIKYIRNKG